MAWITFSNDQLIDENLNDENLDNEIDKVKNEILNNDLI